MFGRCLRVLAAVVILCVTGCSGSSHSDSVATGGHRSKTAQGGAASTKPSTKPSTDPSLSSDAKLASFSVTSESGTPYGFSPAFSAAYTTYATTLLYATSSVFVTAVLSDAVNARMQMQIGSGTWSDITSGVPTEAIAIPVGSTIITIQVTAQNATTKNYSLTVTRLANGDSSLVNLTMSAGSMSPFVATETTYAVTVENGVASVTVTPTASDAKTASIQLNLNNGAWLDVVSGQPSSSLSLTEGPNTIQIRVTAQDKSTSEYLISVTRSAPQSIVQLASLALSDGTLTPAFAANVLSYTAKVPGATAAIDVTATLPVKSNSTFVMRNNGVDVTNPIALVVGANNIDVIVTAENRSAHQTYRIVVTRLRNDATLTKLSLSGVTLTPEFSSNTLEYAATVPYASASTIATLSASDTATAKIQFRNKGGAWASITSGVTASTSSNALTVGENLIEFLVTAQDGSTSTYKVNVTRAANTEARLFSFSLRSSNAALSGLTPAFSRDVLQYTINVASEVATLVPTVAPMDPTNAVVQIRFNGGEWQDPPSTKWTIEPVKDGPNTLEVKVTAQDRKTELLYEIVVVRAVGAPVNFSATGATTSSISLGWDAVADATAYHVYRSPTVDGTYALLQTVTAATAYTDSGLETAKYYFYKVNVTTSVGESPLSTYLRAATHFPAPEGLKVTAAYHDSVSLSWTAMTSPSPRSYRLYRASAAEGPYVVVEADYSAASCTDCTVPSGMYYYKLEAVDKQFTPEIAGELSAAVQASTAVNAELTAPANFQVTNTYATYVDLTWAAQTSATGYLVYLGDSADGTYKRASVVGTSSSWSDMTAQKDYYFKVSAVNANGEGPMAGPINTRTLALPAAPTELKVDRVASSFVTLTWNAVSSAAKYKITYGSSSVTTSSSTASYTLSSVSPGATYSVSVKALRSATFGYYDESPASAPISVSIPYSNSPQNFVCTGVGYEGVSLSFTTVTGVAGYSIARATSPGGPYTRFVDIFTTNSPVTLTDTAVVPGSGTVYYRVTCQNSGGVEVANPAYLEVHP